MDYDDDGRSAGGGGGVEDNDDWDDEKDANLLPMAHTSTEHSSKGKTQPEPHGSLRHSVLQRMQTTLNNKSIMSRWALGFALYLCLSVCLCVCLSLSLSTSLSLSLSLSLSFYPSLSLSSKAPVLTQCRAHGMQMGAPEPTEPGRNSKLMLKSLRTT